MLIKPDHEAAAGTINSFAATVCSNCRVNDHLPLHNVRHCGTFRRLCTTCILRLHRQAFCPTCFQVYPPPPPNGAVLTCFKCYSSTHSHCVASPPSPYICPLCVNPNTPIFKLKTLKDVKAENVEGLGVESKECRVMDREAARKLLAAAKIVSASMNKAAMAAKAEAERRAKEAAFTRKRAKEALEYVAHLVMKEKLRKNEAASLASGQLTGSGFGRFGTNVVYTNGDFVGPKGNPLTVEEKMKPSRVKTDDDRVDMDVDERGRTMGDGGEDGGGLIVEWSDVSDIEQMLFSDEDTCAEN